MMFVHKYHTLVGVQTTLSLTRPPDITLRHKSLLAYSGVSNLQPPAAKHSSDQSSLRKQFIESFLMNGDNILHLPPDAKYVKEHRRGSEFR